MIMENNTYTIISLVNASKNNSISNQEEKELKRVFDLLCNFHIKNKIRIEIKDLETWQNSVKSDTSYQSLSYERETTNLDTAMESTQTRINELKAELLQYDNKNDNKIIHLDIIEIYKFLDHKITKHEAEEMIWEVDEDLDGAVNWFEFRLMFNRNIQDLTGLEPNRLYNLAQYLIYDRNQKGKVSVDGTMEMLYARYGRSKMEEKLKQLFGEDMHETGREGGEISFSKYLHAVEEIHVQAFFPYC